MNLMILLRRNVGFSIAASGLQLLSTLATVRMAGAAAFADLTVDVFKMALIALVLELVPAPYAIFRSQRDPLFGPHMATFALFGSLFCVASWAALAGTGLFASPTLWMAPYAFYLGLQRYLDIKLQAENRIQEYYRMMSVSAGLRLVLTVVGLSMTKDQDVAILWGALSLGSLLSIVVWLVWNPGEMAPFLRRGHRNSVLALYAARGAYYGYYLNAVLKRLRDSFLPVAASFVVTDKVELARYLLAMRGVEFVLGQLRVAEALLSNLGNRAAVRKTRVSHLLILGAFGQLAAFIICTLLAYQAGSSWDSVAVSAIVSLFVYPYVIEIGYRSDAYAEDVPIRITISFAVFTATLVIALAALSYLEFLTAAGLVAAPVLAQAAASLSYLITRQVFLSKHVTNWASPANE